jgi:hypothetical protein
MKVTGANKKNNGTDDFCPWLKKGVNTLIILGAWTIWKHRNACMFEGASLSVNTNLCELKDEHALWCMAGAKKLQGLGFTIAI